MRKNGRIAHLLHLISAYRLEDRNPDRIRPIVMMAEHGMLSEDDAEIHLCQIQALIETQKDFPNLLHRIPTEEQYGAAGTPDIPLGFLAEEPTLPFGLRMLDRPRHVLVAGATGSGKTTAIRLIIRGIDQLNQQRSMSTTCSDGKETDRSDVPQ